MLLYLHGYFARDPWYWVMPGAAPKAFAQSPQLAGNALLCGEFCVCTPLTPPDYYWTRSEPRCLDDGGLMGTWDFEPTYRPLIARALSELVLCLQAILPVDPGRTYLTG